MITAIIQARVGSTRYPNKIFAKLAGKPLIYHVVDRLKKSQRIQNIVIATTINPLDDAIEQWACQNNINCFRGDEENVLSRFYFAAKKFNANIIVRITADDPFKDYEIIDNVIDVLINEQLSFAYNNNPPTFPEGLDTEVFTFDALEEAHNKSNSLFEKEHVTQYFYRNKNSFPQTNVFHDVNISNLRWTIDTQKDMEMARRVYDSLYCENEVFSMNDILQLINKNPEIALINQDVQQSTMYKK
jgi:spore coat polysaccharide biosynthesis protein SpsF